MPRNETRTPAKCYVSEVTFRIIAPTEVVVNSFSQNVTPRFGVLIDGRGGVYFAALSSL